MYIRLVTISHATIERFKNDELSALPPSSCFECVNEFSSDNSSSAENEQEKKQHREHRQCQDERVLASPEHALVLIFARRAAEILGHGDRRCAH
jgi:hypothetical protein